MSDMIREGKFRVLRTIDLRSGQIDAVADLLGIPRDQRQHLQPGELHIVQPLQAAARDTGVVTITITVSGGRATVSGGGGGGT